MVKLIIQITKVVVTIITALLLQSCFNTNWNGDSIDGDGNVVAINRTINESFSAISAQTGLEVYITKGNDVKVLVEADENLQNHIFTEVKDGVLEIYTDASINNCDSKKVYVNVINLENIKSSSGAAIKSNNELKFDKLKLTASSGSNINVKTNTDQISCKSSSGSTITVNGKTNQLTTDASSGSAINLDELFAKKAKANSSSGSSIVLNALEELNADASSGGSVEFISKPNSLIVDESSGGSVSQK
ncbi:MULTISPECIES: head GIN domain-containing protein [Flavobacterium]|uniref:Head GIN domain-containing protein n=1 Tax=Flavobacterium jumunjinense TaxID=998845 RepID=A0ABV5GN28_9FLAO|nr:MULTISPECIES: head GIN domain-containing protein [Flavobacterium]